MYGMEQGLDDHISLKCMNDIGAGTRRPRLLLVYVRYWSTGLDDHVSWKCMYDIGAGIDGHVSW